MKAKILEFLRNLERKFPPGGNGRHSITRGVLGGEEMLILNLQRYDGSDSFFLEEDDLEKPFEALSAELEKLLKRSAK